VWRDSLGQMGFGLATNGNGDSKITIGDYNFWKTNFGNHAGNGSARSLAVPSLCA